MADHSEYRNYMDDDTVELGCHYCKWQEDGIEDDNAADILWMKHINNTFGHKDDPFGGNYDFYESTR